MTTLPKIRINGRLFFLDQRLREIRAVANPHEIYLLSQVTIPPTEAPPFRLVQDHAPQTSTLTAFINALPPEDKNTEGVPPRERNALKTPRKTISRTRDHEP